MGNFADQLNRAFAKRAPAMNGVIERMIKHELSITPEQSKEIKAAVVSAKILAADVAKRTDTDVVAVLASISGALNDAAMNICAKERESENNAQT